MIKRRAPIGKGVAHPNGAYQLREVQKERQSDEPNWDERLADSVNPDEGARRNQEKNGSRDARRIGAEVEDPIDVEEPVQEREGEEEDGHTGRHPQAAKACGGPGDNESEDAVEDEPGPDRAVGETAKVAPVLTIPLEDVPFLRLVNSKGGRRQPDEPAEWLIRKSVKSFRELALAPALTNTASALAVRASATSRRSSARHHRKGCVSSGSLTRGCSKASRTAFRGGVAAHSREVGKMRACSAG
jgi:hypothetical protein